MIKSEYQNDGYTNEQILQFIESNALNKDSNIIRQAGDGGPIITFDVVNEVFIDDPVEGAGENTILISGDDEPISPNSNKMTLEEFIKILKENISKIVVTTEYLPIKELIICQNFKELEEYIKYREYGMNVSPEMEKANLNYPVLVLDDCL